MSKSKPGIDRRRFLQAAAVLTAAAGTPGTARAQACPRPPAVHRLNRRAPALADLTGGRPPNILVVLTDQERWRGNLPPTLKRPNYERLCANAVSFDRAFCAYPLCSPSRSALMTGLYPHQNGVTHNVNFITGKGVLDPQAPHLGSVLASAGYRIAYRGKWDISRPRDWYTGNIRHRGLAGDYGYEGHCDNNLEQEYGHPIDGQVVADSCQWVREQDRQQPWHLVCSIINPHDICHPQLKPDNVVRPDVILPESLHDDLAGKPADQRLMRDSVFSHLNQVLHPAAKSFDQYNDHDWKLFLSFYYDLIEGTDAYIGQLLEALEATGQLDNTIVVYTSDHGEMGGSHGFSGKYEVYEEAVHVPLCFYHPRLEARDIGQTMVSNTDLAPTIAALAGVQWPAPVAGQDLSGWLNGQGGPVSEAAFIETETNVNALVYRRQMATRAIRTERWKCTYSFYDVQDGQLYDLENDPAEINNLFHDPAHAATSRELIERLRAWQIETNDPFQGQWKTGK